MILVGNTILQGHEGAAVHQVVADMSHKLKSSKKVEKGWKVLNVLHRVCKNHELCPPLHPMHWIFPGSLLFRPCSCHLLAEISRVLHTCHSRSLSRLSLFSRYGLVCPKYPLLSSFDCSTYRSSRSTKLTYRENVQ